MRLLTALYALAAQAQAVVQPPPALPQPGVTAGGAKVVSVALHANPALWLIGALIVGSLLEAFVLLLLYRAAEPLRKQVSGAFVWAVHPFTGPDGRPSFSKIVDLLVLGGYWSGAPIPEGVAMLVIGSAHGTKVLLAIVDKLSLNVSSATNLARSTLENTTNLNTNTKIDERRELITRAEQTTRTIDEKIGRGPTGEPLRSNPPVAGATTPAGED